MKLLLILGVAISFLTAILTASYERPAKSPNE